MIHIHEWLRFEAENKKMKDEKSATDHTLDVTLKRVDQLHNQVEELKTQLLTKGNHKNSSIRKRLPWVQFNFTRFSFTTDQQVRNPGSELVQGFHFFCPGPVRSEVWSFSLIQIPVDLEFHFFGQINSVRGSLGAISFDYLEFDCFDF